MNLLKKYYHSLLEKREKQSLSRYFLSIKELPVYNWWLLHEENDFKHLLRNPKAKLNNRCKKVSLTLQNECIDTFGLDNNYKEYLNKKIDIELLKIKISLTGDKSHQIFIDIMEIDLARLSSQEKEKDLNQNTIAIEKYMGFSLDTKKITVFQYYSYIKSIEKANKAA